MNTGYDWQHIPSHIRRIVKRKCLSGPAIAHECQFCGGVFDRKHVRWVDDGWSCRDRCERDRKGLP